MFPKRRYRRRGRGAASSSGRRVASRAWLGLARPLRHPTLRRWCLQYAQRGAAHARAKAYGGSSLRTKRTPRRALARPDGFASSSSLKIEALSPFGHCSAFLFRRCTSVACETAEFPLDAHASSHERDRVVRHPRQEAQVHRHHRARRRRVGRPQTPVISKEQQVSRTRESHRSLHPLPPGQVPGEEIPVVGLLCDEVHGWAHAFFGSPQHPPSGSLSRRLRYQPF